jgi:cell shape-determining protein MreC
MKKTSRSRGRVGAARILARWYGLFALVAVVVVVLVWRGAFAGLLWRAVAPLSAWSDSSASSQVEQLQMQLASTTAMLADRDMLYQENLALKAALGRSANQPLLLAAVLMRPPETPYDTLMLDAGSDQGVVVGDQLSAGGEVVIGTVAQVYPTTARAVLYSAPGQSFSAVLTSGDAAGVPITVTGQGGGSMLATVPAGTPAVVGESVVFPGVAGGFSGTISAVVAKTGDSFETLYLHLPVDPLALRFVEILK